MTTRVFPDINIQALRVMPAIRMEKINHDSYGFTSGE